MDVIKKLRVRRWWGVVGRGRRGFAEEQCLLLASYEPETLFKKHECNEEERIRIQKVNCNFNFDYR